jgi:hypothetical protein
MSFESKHLKIFVIMVGLILFFVTSDHVSFGADSFRYDHDICGKIIDFDTRKPIEGVVVSAVWFIESIRLSIEPKRKYHDYFETLTNQEGEFKIQGKGLNIIRSIPPPTICIFKAGYSILYLQDLGEYFKRDHPLADEVKWVEGKPIIPFRKQTLAKRKRYLRSHPTLPFSGMEYCGIQSEKVRLFSGELEREYQATGMTPVPLNDQPYLRYKKGGVFPAEKKQAKRNKLK